MGGVAERGGGGPVMSDHDGVTSNEVSRVPLLGIINCNIISIIRIMRNTSV